MKKNIGILLLSLILMLNCSCDEKKSIETQSTNSLLEHETQVIESIANIEQSNLGVMEKLELVDNRLIELEQTDVYCNSDDSERARLVASVLSELAIYGIDEYPYPLLDYGSIEIDTDALGDYYFVGFTIDGIYCQFDVSEYPYDPTAKH